MTAREEFPDVAQAVPFDAVRAEIDGLIEHAVVNQPRSLQKRLGPSEFGVPCDLKLAYMLLGHPECNPSKRLPWKPFVGTAVHEALAVILEQANAPLDEPRWLVEHKVPITRLGADDIDGSCDLYDRFTGTVLDWKIVGGEQLRKYRATGPGRQYREQAHLYGYGWRRRGYTVHTVAVYFLPRDQEWRQRHIWHEPYDEQIALASITRVQGIASLTGALGTAALPLMQRADAWCVFCPWLKPGSDDLARGCPGHPDAVPAASDSLRDLIAQ